jgi:SAM-dependent methyltransferase
VYRDHLYGQYVSTFKSTTHRADDDASVWWDHKLLPLLDGLPTDAAILDVGCGSGALLEYLRRRGFSHAAGVDISAEQIALAQQRGVNAVQADALEHLRGNPNRYQVIIAVDVLEHFTRNEDLNLVQLAFEALEPHARLLVQTANGAGLFPGQVIYGDLTHQTIFTPESLGQLLRSVGFVNLRFYETGPIPIRVRGKVDVALWSAIKAVANTLRHIETGKRQSIWTENFICRAFKPG